MMKGGEEGEEQKKNVPLVVCWLFPFSSARQHEEKHTHLMPRVRDRAIAPSLRV